MKIVGVIPARYSSSRLPGKPLIDICGMPMIWWVYNQAIKCKDFESVIVATDDQRIVSVCQEVKIPVMLTSINHDTPTSRVWEVSTKIDADLYVVVMGDEPLVNEECFSLIIPSKNISEYYVGALTNIIDNPADVIDFSNQKVVTNAQRETLLISRSPIPYPKGTLDIQYEKVTGVQIFSKKALQFYAEHEKSNLEKAEENDLMRFVENGVKVIMTTSPYRTISVDTSKDVDEVIKILQNNG